MADSDLLLRPKVDPSSLKSSSQKMERSYRKAMMNASRATAKYTQRALTAAIRQAAKAGGSAMHSAFQVGLGAILEQMQSLIQDIDDTVARTKDRATDISSTLKRAQAFNMSGAELYALETAALSVNLDQTAVQGVLEGFKDSLVDSDLFGERYRNIQAEQGTWEALMEFVKREVSGRTPEHAQKALAAGGMTGSGQTELLQLMQATGGQSLEQVSQRLLGISMSEIGKMIASNELSQGKFLEQLMRERRNDLQQASKASSNVETIRTLDQKNLEIANQQERALKDSAQFRIQVLNMQQEVNKITTDAMQHMQNVLQAFEKGGFTAALSEAVSPIASAITNSMRGLKDDIKQAITESVPSWMQNTQKDKIERKASPPPAQLRTDTSNWRK